MPNLTGKVIERQLLTSQDIDAMYCLMDSFYDHMDKEIFLRDLSAKEYCILLRDESEAIQGFSTQKLLSFLVDGRPVHGVFSGDTIIHPDYWGSPVLFQQFARFFFSYGERYAHFYWFLISKGYKTYRILPTFFREFYPNYRKATPNAIKRLMDEFGAEMYPKEYNSGVIVYRQIKDCLRQGVADLTPQRLKNPDIVFFVHQNPGYQKGDDLVCVAELTRSNLRPHTERVLFG